jgi:hypothetical protein
MRRSEVGLVFGDAVLVHARQTPRAARTCFGITRPRRGRVATELAWGNFVPTSTVLVRRRCLDEAGAFSLERSLSVDYLTWFRIATRYELDYVEEPGRNASSP